MTEAVKPLECVRFERFWNRFRVLAAGVDPLDVGCGTGHYLVECAPMVGRARGMDRNRTMIEIARRKLDRAVVLEVSDITRLPCPPSQFDVVLCNTVLHHLDEPESHRVSTFPKVKEFFQEAFRTA